MGITSGLVPTYAFFYNHHLWCKAQEVEILVFGSLLLTEKNHHFF